MTHTVGAIHAYLAAADTLLRDDASFGADRTPFRRYYRALLRGEPGALEATARNLEIGLTHLPRGTLVDIGCGHGLQAYVFAASGYRVIGVDQQMGRIELARRLADRLGVGIEYHCGDAVEVLRSSRVDGVWMHRVIHHIEPLPPFLDAVAGALRPGGALVVTTQRARRIKRLRDHSRPFYRAAELADAFAPHGLSVVRVERHGYMSALPARLRPRGTAAIDAALARVPGLRRLGGSYTMVARRSGA